MRLYFKYLSVLLKGQMAYRASFLLLTAGQFFVTVSYFLGVFFLFSFFGSLRGWSFWEVMLCTGAVQVSYPLAECFARGFDGFSAMIRTGSFDTVLLRPRSVFMQIFGSRFDFSRVGRLAQGLLILSLAVARGGVDWDPLKAAMLVLMVLSGTVIFAGMFILGATLCFWTVEGLEVVNILTDGGREISQYPFEIYKKGFLLFFTFVVPYACANYYPVLYLTGRADSPLWGVLAPLLGMLFILPAMGIFRLGVRRYTSTGS